MLFNPLLTSQIFLVNQLISWFGAVVFVIGLTDWVLSMIGYFSEPTNQKNAEINTTRSWRAGSTLLLGVCLFLTGIFAPLFLVIWRLYTRMSR